MRFWLRPFSPIDFEKLIFSKAIGEGVINHHEVVWPGGGSGGSKGLIGTSEGWSWYILQSILFLFVQAILTCSLARSTNFPTPSLSIILPQPSRGQSRSNLFTRLPATVFVVTDPIESNDDNSRPVLLKDDLCSRASQTPSGTCWWVCKALAAEEKGVGPVTWFANPDASVVFFNSARSSYHGKDPYTTPLVPKLVNPAFS